MKAAIPESNLFSYSATGISYLRIAWRSESVSSNQGGKLVSSRWIAIVAISCLSAMLNSLRQFPDCTAASDTKYKKTLALRIAAPISRIGMRDERIYSGLGAGQYRSAIQNIINNLNQEDQQPRKVIPVNLVYGCALISFSSAKLRVGRRIKG